MKVGLIRCKQTEDMCPATTSFKVIQDKKLAFEGITQDVTLVGVNTCGGCPGKKAVTRVAEMIKRGADTIVFSSCISKGTPIGFPCPHAEIIREAVLKKMGELIKIIEYTH